jgi:hypothetical protein
MFFPKFCCLQECLALSQHRPHVRLFSPSLHRWKSRTPFPSGSRMRSLEFISTGECTRFRHFLTNGTRAPCISKDRQKTNTTGKCMAIRRSGHTAISSRERMTRPVVLYSLRLASKLTAADSILTNGRSCLLMQERNSPDLSPSTMTVFRCGQARSIPGMQKRWDQNLIWWVC